MKRIELLKKDGDFDERELLREVARRPADPRVGIDIEEMRRAMRVLDALDKATDSTLDLEDADHGYLVEKLKRFRFAFADQKILDLVERISSDGASAKL